MVDSCLDWRDDFCHQDTIEVGAVSSQREDVLSKGPASSKSLCRRSLAPAGHAGVITLSPDIRSEFNAINAHATRIKSTIARLTDIKGELSDR